MEQKSNPFASFVKKVSSFLETPQAGAPAQPPQGQQPRPRQEAKGTDTFQRSLEVRPAPAPTVKLSAPPIEQTPETREEESRKRLAFVTAYLQNSEEVPQLKDPRFVYKLVSDERAYQTQLYNAASARLKEFLAAADPAFLTDQYDFMPAMELGPDGQLTPEAQEVLAKVQAKRAWAEKREQLEKDVQKVQDIQTQLFLVLKKVTGKRGHTGGTGFLAGTDPG